MIRRQSTTGLLRTVLIVALAAALSLWVLPSAIARANFGIVPGSFVADGYDSLGGIEDQAGAHPYRATTDFRLDLKSGGEENVDGSVKDLHFDLPPGFVGNPETTARCPRAVFAQLAATQPGPDAVRCPVDSQIGVASVHYRSYGSDQDYFQPVYNLEPSPGHAAQMGMIVVFVPVIINATIDTAGNYGLEADVSKTSQGVNISGVKLDLWGVPNDPTHDSERYCGNGQATETCHTTSPLKPFLTNPTACEGPLTSTMNANSWQEPDASSSASYVSSGITGCDSLAFESSATVRPEQSTAETPTGLSVDLTIPQRDDVAGRAPSTMKRTTVVLPAGMSINPSSASGLEACSSSQIALHSNTPVTCPESSKIGSVEFDTPLLSDPLTGSVYLARQGDNPFGGLLGLYLVVADPARGILIKLAGKVEADPSSGQLVTTFDNNPQLPFTELHLKLKGGSRAPLVTPSSCGTYVSTVEMTPWSGNAPVTSSTQFQITAGPNGAACPANRFSPAFSAGTANPIAGHSSSFSLRISREDGSARLGSIVANLPKGLLAKLAGVPYCPDSALGSVSGEEGTAAAQITNPSCPAASQVGTVTVGAGAGPNPFYVDTGKVYLAGPYKGASLSLAVVTPALAGPFDLGSVVVRNALQVDPITAQVTAVSDPLPTILHGIPLDLRDLRINIDRPEFTLNPTSCEPMAVTSTIASVSGQTATPSSRFQVADCERLAFEPALKLQLTGQTKRTGNPAIKAVLTQPKGENANIAGTTVILPKSMFIDQSHVNGPCTRVQFNEGKCPASSILGTATAYSPLLEKPLTGPVYFRSNGGERKLPDLVADLDGQIHVTLVGFIDSVKAGKESSRVRTRFQSVPDAPVSRFVLQLKGGKRGLIQNSKDLCRSRPKASVKTTGQNGKTFDFEQKMNVSCKRKGKKK